MHSGASHCFGGMVIPAISAASPTAPPMVYPVGPSSRWPACKRWRENANRPHGVPTMFIAMLDHPQFADLTSPACAPASARQPCPTEVMKRVVDKDEHARGDHRLRHDETSPVSL